MSYVTFNEKINGRDFTIQRVSYTIEDSMKQESEGGALLHYKKVTVRGMMKKSEIETVKIAYKNTDPRIEGNGTLHFTDIKYGDDYLTIDNISILSISEQSSLWDDWGEIEAVFGDDLSNKENNGVLIFRGTEGRELLLYNSSLTVNFSRIRKGSNIVKNYNGSFLQDVGYDFVVFSLSGSIPYDSCDYPENIIDTIEAYEVITGDKDYLEDKPICENLNYFLPDLQGCNVTFAFVNSSSITWNIEKKEIDVNIEIIAPDQYVDLKVEANT